MNSYNTSTKLDAAQTQPGFLDVKMRTKIVTPPSDLVAVLGAEARLSCQVRHHRYSVLLLNTLSAKKRSADMSFIETFNVLYN